jgi:replicative superfamily II helicase
MVGRAGRAGLDVKGDSIAILHPGREVDLFLRMLDGPLEPCQSGLHDEQQLEAFVLDLISLKVF